MGSKKTQSRAKWSLSLTSNHFTIVVTSTTRRYISCVFVSQLFWWATDDKFQPRKTSILKAIMLQGFNLLVKYPVYLPQNLELDDVAGKKILRLRVRTVQSARYPSKPELSILNACRDCAACVNRQRVDQASRKKHLAARHPKQISLDLDHCPCPFVSSRFNPLIS